MFKYSVQLIPHTLFPVSSSSNELVLKLQSNFFLSLVYASSLHFECTPLPSGKSLRDASLLKRVFRRLSESNGVGFLSITTSNKMHPLCEKQSSRGISYQREIKSEVICWVDPDADNFMNEGPHSSTDSCTIVTPAHQSLWFQSILRNEMCTWLLLKTSIKYLQQ